MNLYYYRLLLPNGKLRSGLVKLSVERDASARLWLERQYGATVVRLRRMPRWAAEAHRSVSDVFRPGIRPKELSGMLRDLAVMTGSGIPLLEAVRTVSEENANKRSNVARVGKRLLEDLDAGAPISEAVGRQPDIFPETVRNLILIGDETGSMDRMLLESAEHLERIAAMKADTRQALIYPAFVFLAIFGAAGFWIHYVIPNLVGLFQQMNAKLPALTIAVLDGAAWLTRHFGKVTVGMVVLFVSLWLAWRYFRPMRRAGFYLLHRLPVSRVIVTSSGLAFFAEYMAILIHAGLDVVKSLSILGRAIGDDYYRDRIVAIRQIMERGEGISTAMRHVGGFPPIMMRMIAVGEETGTLDRQLSYLAKEYGTRLARVIAMLSEVIKPLVILIAGAMFTLLIVALLLPVYDLVRQSMAARPM
ncbi:type II secretion system F family protein [Bordetella bronchiseptica]|nr:type II secretion system F family protein [Bordetella bronchiseptica]